MKKSIKKPLLIILVLGVIFSCSNDELMTKESTIKEESVITGNTNKSASSKSANSALVPTICDVLGDEIVSPGSTLVYNYTASFSPITNVQWSASTGISIISGQGTSTVTLQFGVGFSGGTISAIGTGNNNNGCNVIDQQIYACAAPTGIDIIQKENYGECPGDNFIFNSNLLGGNTTGGTYKWQVYNGASIVGSSTSSSVKVLSPSSGSYLVKVTFTSDCQNTVITEITPGTYDHSCGGGPGPGI